MSLGVASFCAVAWQPSTINAFYFEVQRTFMESCGGQFALKESLQQPRHAWVHSSVVRAADCRSAGPWFKSGCALSLQRQCDYSSDESASSSSQQPKPSPEGPHAEQPHATLAKGERLLRKLSCRRQLVRTKLLGSCPIVGSLASDQGGWQKSGHPESNQGPSDCCSALQSDALPTEL